MKIQRKNPSAIIFICFSLVVVVTVLISRPMKPQERFNVYENAAEYLDKQAEKDAQRIRKSSAEWINPVELEVGRTYLVSEKTALMPAHTPTRDYAAVQDVIEQVIYIPATGGFRILEIHLKNVPWYKASAFDNRKKDIGIGWINSDALSGQDLGLED